MTKEELVNLCKEGDEQALSLLYKTYAKKMKRICCRYVSDEQTVNDLLHDGFIIIFTSIDTLRSSEKLESWMGKIMKNISLKYLEQCRAITHIPLDCIEEFEEPLIPSYSTDFPSYAIMLKMVESLPKGYCKIFKLAVLEGLSHPQIRNSLCNVMVAYWCLRFFILADSNHHKSYSYCTTSPYPTMRLEAIRSTIPKIC